MENPVIKITDGQLKGTVETNMDDEKFYSFLGIPYGRPPIGELRFKAPLPAESWEGIWDATKEREKCFQVIVYTEPSGSEDCLYLNVFTKALPNQENKLKPVMVYIHGGGFVNGSGGRDMYGPGILMTEDIVFVTLNYRVGVLGFLSLKDTSLEVPGNAGLKDQTLALKWVQKNIKFFNGDPNNVTIFGESAGAASVHCQILSPSAKGLFHKAIVQSGTVLSQWAFSDEHPNEFVKYLGISTTNEKEILDKLRELPAEELLKAQKIYNEEKNSAIKIFGPVVENHNDTEFISQDPIDILKSGEYNKVPFIIGYTSNEGLLDAMSEMLSKMQGKSLQPKTFDDDFFPWQVELKKGSDARNIAVEKMKNFYENEENKDNPYLAGSDSYFIAGTIATVNMHLKTQQEPIYLYRMSIITDRNFLSRRMNIDPKLGVCHGDDIGYLFTNNTMSSKIPKGSPGDIGTRRFIKLWTNFAKFGNPTPDQKELGILWKAVEKNSRNFLDIGKDLVVETNPEAERMQLWKEIYEMNPHTAPLLQ